MARRLAALKRAGLDNRRILRYIEGMTSEAQIAANRVNARRSTGPNTPEGKATSSQNARKRRLPGETPLTLAEDEAAFAGHCDGVRSALLPQDAFEEELVRQIALHQWRLGRLQRIEAALFDAETRRVEYRRGAHFDPSALHFHRMQPTDIWPGPVAELSRREAAIERALGRTVALLERHRAAGARRDAAAKKMSGDEAKLPSEINGPG
jgi:hypothetical protein